VVQVTVHMYNPGDYLPSRDSELHSEERQDARERNQNEPTDDNAATAPGKVCELCGAVIKAGQEARRRVSGEWIHEACPIQ
jgi:hypothetical protein